LQLSQRSLIDGAEDVRTALRRNVQECVQLTSENLRLRELLAASDIKLSVAANTNRTIQEAARLHEVQVSLLRVALEARALEVAKLHGSLDLIAQTNAVLAAQRAPVPHDAKAATEPLRPRKRVKKMSSPQS